MSLQDHLNSGAGAYMLELRVSWYLLHVYVVDEAVFIPRMRASAASTCAGFISAMSSSIDFLSFFVRLSFLGLTGFIWSDVSIPNAIFPPMVYGAAAPRDLIFREHMPTLSRNIAS